VGKTHVEAGDAVDEKEDVLMSGGVRSVSGKVGVVGMEGVVGTALRGVPGGELGVERVVEMERKRAICARLRRDAYEAKEVSVGA